MIIEAEACPKAAKARTGKTGKIQRICAGPALSRQQIPYHLAQILQRQGFSLPICQKVFTLASEMINNAIDHGLLSLPSALKDEPEGLTDFYQLRDERLQQLSLDQQISTYLHWDEAAANVKFIELEVRHNGTSRCADPIETPSDRQCSGRGLMLIRALSSEFESREGGHLTRIRLNY